VEVNEMPTLYTRVNYFRDDRNTWYGRWGRNKNNACLGNGFGIGYDKGFYTDPVRENCGSGGPVMSMTLIADMLDPNIDKMDKALASGR
jgi:hypothetical protein